MIDMYHPLFTLQPVAFGMGIEFGYSIQIVPRTWTRGRARRIK